VLDGWYDRFYPDASKAIDLRNGNAIVKINNKYNVMRLSDDPIGEWMFDRWYDGCRFIPGSCTLLVVMQDDKYNLWNTDHLEFDHWYDYVSYDDSVGGYWFGDYNDNPDKHTSVKAYHNSSGLQLKYIK
jgi:hypothetical protein